jgi:hypothetical protein
MKHLITRERVHLALRSACIALFTTLVTLAAIEIVLRLADLRILREGASERSLTHRYDTELGWVITAGIVPMPVEFSEAGTEV